MPTPKPSFAFIRRVSRSLAVLLIAATAVLLLAGESPAQAQAERILVSNLGNANKNIDESRPLAQIVTAGDNPWGYRVTSVEVRSRDTQEFSLKVCGLKRSSRGILIPDEEVCTDFTSPGTFATGTLSFSAPSSGFDMASGRFYALVFAPTGSGTVKLNGSEDKSETGLLGWKIGNTYKFKSGNIWFNKEAWRAKLKRKHIRVAVKGNPNPSPTIAQNAPLVSNIPEANRDIQVSSDSAQSFVVGDSFFRFDVESIDVISRDAEGDDLALKVCATDGAGFPDTSDCTTFTAPQSFATSTLAFTAPTSGFTLSPNATYSVVLSSPGGDTVNMGGTGGNGESGRIRWAIEDTFQYLNSGVWARSNTNDSFRIAVKGSVKQPGSNDPRVLVSNVRRVSSLYSYPTRSAGGWSRLQRFTTGSNGGDYSITAAELGLNPTPETNGFKLRVGPYPTLTLHSGSASSNPALATFTPPQSRDVLQSGSYTFTLASPFALQADTHYWLRAQGGDALWNITHDSRKDPSTLTGWRFDWSQGTDGHNRFRIIGALTAGLTSTTQAMVNSPASGLPRIEGALEVGNTLQADLATVSDADGLDSASFSHQWLADEEEIEEARGTEYTLTASDEGMVIRVRVDFTDDNGNQESLISEPTSAVVAATSPRLQSATVDGGTLTLAFDEELDNSALMSSDLFTVNVNGASRAVMGVAVGQSDVVLLLSLPVEAGETVTVDYTAPTDEGSARLQDTSGNAAESFSGQAVTNATASSGGERSNQQSQPGAPTHLKVAQKESGQLKATWRAPGSGPVPTAYTVQWKAAADEWEDPNEVSETDVTKTSHVIVGLTDGVDYSVRVIATKDDVAGDPTEEVAATPRDTTAPGISSAAVDGPEITLTFDEALDDGETPDKSAFAVTVGSEARDVDAVVVSGSAVTLTLVTAVSSGDAVAAGYTVPTGDSESRLQDLVGNAAASFSGEAVANDTVAANHLTASTLDVPANHDGNSKFTFELRFSEDLRLSYKTLRDHAFRVTGGEVTKARRLARPSNVRWEIHVTPNGSGTVTVVLPVTMDCTAQGAICTRDRRPLSNRLEKRVPGPG